MDGGVGPAIESARLPTGQDARPVIPSVSSYPRSVPRLASASATTLALAAALALSSGCSILGSAGTDGADAVPSVVDDFPRSRHVALDFVDAMATLPALAPRGTTLYAARPPSRFGGILVGALQSAGYDLRLGADDAPLTLDYDVSAAAPGDDVGRYTFRVVADGVRLERSYVADVAGIRPITAMRVNGRELATDAPAPVVTAVPLVPSPVAVAPVPERKGNVYETRRSNYADLLVSYDTLRRDVMVFPNDSLHMGRDNKRLARRIADAFDPERDVISVIGCSHGRTALDDGNERLANGRALRVKEAFVLAGIDADLVLEEGCWAGHHFEKMPARGVVVTHQRRAAG